MGDSFERNGRRYGVGGHVPGMGKVAQIFPDGHVLYHPVAMFDKDGKEADTGEPVEDPRAAMFEEAGRLAGGMNGPGRGGNGDGRSQTAQDPRNAAVTAQEEAVEAPGRSFHFKGLTPHKNPHLPRRLREPAGKPQARPPAVTRPASHENTPSSIIAHNAMPTPATNTTLPATPGTTPPATATASRKPYTPQPFRPGRVFDEHGEIDLNASQWARRNVKSGPVTRYVEGPPVSAMQKPAPQAPVDRSNLGPVKAKPDGDGFGGVVKQFFDPQRDMKARPPGPWKPGYEPPKPQPATAPPQRTPGHVFDENGEVDLKASKDAWRTGADHVMRYVKQPGAQGQGNAGTPQVGNQAAGAPSNPVQTQAGVNAPNLTTPNPGQVNGTPAAGAPSNPVPPQAGQPAPAMKPNGMPPNPGQPNGAPPVKTTAMQGVGPLQKPRPMVAHQQQSAMAPFGSPAYRANLQAGVA